jgi:Holliday junction DNA helicase RuvA
MSDIISQIPYKQLDYPMIGKLTGRVDSTSNDHVIIDVGGVGYLAYCSGKTLSKLEPGSTTSLVIETHVREDHIHLYGFSSNDERNTFTLLQSVKGVGTRMALGILSAMSPEEIQLSLSQRDMAAFNNISGIGKKLAERIITELKDKFISIASSNFGYALDMQGQSSNSSDAISALVSLGINRVDAQNRVAAILTNDANTPIGELIRIALKGGV